MKRKNDKTAKALLSWKKRTGNAFKAPKVNDSRTKKALEYMRQKPYGGGEVEI